VVYFIKVTKLVKLIKFGLFEDFRVLYYIKVLKFIKLEKTWHFRRFSSAIQYNIHKVR